jgi:hypothetical protein
MSNNKAKELTVNYVDVDVARISATELQENDRSKGQRIAYPRYHHSILGENQALMMQFPWIRLETYGVPRAGEYFKTDADRSFVKVPLNTSVPEVASLVEKLKEIDAYFASEDFASKLLGKKWNKYTYQPIYREANVPQGDDSDEETTAAKKQSDPKLPYLKLKIDTEYGSNAIKTQLFRSETVDGKRVRTEVKEMECLDDFTKLVSYQSNFRPITRLVKFWAQPLTKKDPTWGATLKIVKAEVEPSSKGNGLYKQYMNADAFLDSDEEVKVPVQSQSHQDKKAVPVSKKTVEVESDDQSDEEEKPAAKVTTSSVKQTVQVESDDDSESEEEEKAPAKKPAAKSTRGGKGGKSAHA